MNFTSTGPNEKKPIDQIDLTFDETRALALRVKRIAERIAGFGNTKSVEQNVDVDICGELNQLITKSGEVLSDIADANKALDHLEKII
jgi:Trp operon repressor